MTVNIRKNQFISLLYDIHSKNSYELIENITNYLKEKNEVSEVNKSEIDKFLFDNLLLTLRLRHNLNKYNIIHKDLVNDEQFNEISLDLLEDDENFETKPDDELALKTVEEVYEEFIVYGARNEEIYVSYINKICKNLDKILDNSLSKKMIYLLKK